MGEKHYLKVPGEYSKIQSVCGFVAEGARRSGLDESSVFHVELACDEACSNIIEHGYGGEGEGEIRVSWQLDDDLFRVTIHDHGRPFKPDDVEEPTISMVEGSDIAEKQIKVGGFGIHFMRKLMDEVHFQFNQEMGNTLTMVKRIPKK